MDGGVVQVIPVGRSLDKLRSQEFRSWSVQQCGILQALSLFLM